MSISVGAGGVVTVGAIGDSQGARAALNAPPSGCIGMQVVWRGWFDTFVYNGTIFPYGNYTTDANLTDYYTTTSTWETIFAYGLCFDNVQPTRNTTVEPGLPTTNKSFFGFVTGGGRYTSIYSFDYHIINYRTSVFGNISSWARYSYGYNNFYRTFCGILTKQTKASSSLFADVNNTGAGLGYSQFANDLSSSYPLTRLSAWPANPTDGAKYAMGWDIRKSLTNHSVSFRFYINTGSLSEANLMNVFTSYDMVSPAYQINRSTSTIDADDAWINGSGDFVAPSYVMMRNGLPGQGFTLNKVAYRYLT